MDLLLDEAQIFSGCGFLDLAVPPTQNIRPLALGMEKKYLHGDLVRNLPQSKQPC